MSQTYTSFIEELEQARSKFAIEPIVEVGEVSFCLLNRVLSVGADLEGEVAQLKDQILEMQEYIKDARGIVLNLLEGSEIDCESELREIQGELNGALNVYSPFDTP